MYAYLFKKGFVVINKIFLCISISTQLNSTQLNSTQLNSTQHKLNRSIALNFYIDENIQLTII